MLELFNQDHSFILLLAPPASGKTSFLISLLEDSRKYQWVFVSPLRALADEFKQRVQLYPHIIVETAEKLLSNQYHEYFDRDDVIFVLDEFHLIYFWGMSFRQSLLEIWYKVALSRGHTLALTATFPESISNEAIFDIRNNFNHFYQIDCGNMQFKKAPNECIVIAESKRKTWQKICELEILKLKMNRKRMILFVAYREEVDLWLKFATNHGVLALGCKGGEVEKFRLELSALQERVQIIIATSCLGHGVNLPSFDLVMINHLVSESFWIQMIARAGRQGEAFRAVSCQKGDESYYLLKNLSHRIQLWYLKELSYINKLIKKEIL